MTIASQWTRMLFVASLITTSTAFSSSPAFQRDSKVGCLSMVKRSDRAFIDKNLEDAMNNDWRVFRASLVAKEQAESKRRANTPNGKKENAVKDAKLAKQGDLGDMFADAISSIFSNKEKDGDFRGDIFDGDTVGGVALPEVLKCEDPFLSRAELPMLMNSKISIDKHRWAHTISYLEPGCVLVANEKLGGVFHQTVVLIIDHCESQGSTGIIINR